MIAVIDASAIVAGFLRDEETRLGEAVEEFLSERPVSAPWICPYEVAGAIAAARRHSIELPDVQPRTLTDVLTDSDFVVTVCDQAHEELGVTGNLHWSIPDPVRIGTAAAFETTFTELQRRISDLAPRLAAS